MKTKLLPPVTFLAAALLCAPSAFAQIKAEQRPVRVATPAAVPAAPTPPVAVGVPGLSPVPAPSAPRKLDEFGTDECSLREAVSRLESYLQPIGLGGMNILFGPGTEALPVPALRLHNVTGPDALQLIAAAAECTVEPMFSTEGINSQAPLAAGGRIPIIGYQLRAKAKPAAAAKPVPFAPGVVAGGQAFAAVPGMPGRMPSATSPAGRVTRIYPLGSVTGLKLDYNRLSSSTREFYLNRYFKYQIDFPELEKTLREALKADGVAENQITLAFHEKSNVLVVNATESAQGLIEQVLAALRSNAAEAEAKNMERDKALGRVELEAAVNARQRLEEELARRSSELRDLQKAVQRQDAVQKPPSAK